MNRIVPCRTSVITTTAANKLMDIGRLGKLKWRKSCSGFRSPQRVGHDIATEQQQQRDNLSLIIHLCDFFYNRKHPVF